MSSDEIKFPWSTWDGKEWKAVGPDEPLSNWLPKRMFEPGYTPGPRIILFGSDPALPGDSTVIKLDGNLIEYTTYSGPKPEIDPEYLQKLIANLGERIQKEMDAALVRSYATELREPTLEPPRLFNPPSPDDYDLLWRLRWDSNMSWKLPSFDQE